MIMCVCPHPVLSLSPSSSIFPFHYLFLFPRYSPSLSYFDFLMSLFFFISLTPSVSIIRSFSRFLLSFSLNLYISPSLPFCSSLSPSILLSLGNLPVPLHRHFSLSSSLWRTDGLMIIVSRKEGWNCIGLRIRLKA